MTGNSLNVFQIEYEMPGIKCKRVVLEASDNELIVYILAKLRFLM